MPAQIEQYARLRGVSYITAPLIRVETLEGAGTPDDPMRLVVSYFMLDGTLMAHSEDRRRKFRGVANAVPSAPLGEEE